MRGQFVESFAEVLNIWRWFFPPFHEERHLFLDRMPFCVCRVSKISLRIYQHIKPMRYTNRLTAAALFLLLGWLAPSVDAGTVNVLFNDSSLRYTLLTRQEGQTEYVNLQKAADMFQFTFETDPTDGRVTAQYHQKSLTFFPDQPEVWIAERSYALAAPPRRIEGVLMVPFEFLTKTLPLIYEDTVLWDARARTLTVGIADFAILGIEASPFAEYTRLAVQLSQPVPYKIVEKLPSMLIFEFPQGTFEIVDNPVQINTPAIRHAKLIESFGTTQMIVRLGEEFVRYTHKINTDGDVCRLLIDVFTTDAEIAEEPTPTPEPEATEEPTPPADGAIVEQDLAPEEAQASAALPARPFSLQSIVVDAGHGGSDQGVTVIPAKDNTPALMEKQLTLRLAELLKAALVERLGIKVMLTREGDDFVSGETRATIANSNRADLFISLHVNFSTSAQANGFEAYIMDYGSLEKPVGAQAQMLDYAQAKYAAQSQRLAEQIVAARQARNARAVVKRAPLFTLKGATMPSVHLELGYGSHPQERVNLAQPEFQHALIEAIVDGIAAFKKGEQP